MNKKMSISTTVLLSVLTIVLFQISGKANEVRAAEGQEKQESQAQRPRGDDALHAERCDRRVAACGGGTYRRSSFALRGPCVSDRACTASRRQAWR